MENITQEQLDAMSSKAREVRDMLLAETDWWAVQDRTMSQEEKDYRKALRDLPSQEGFPLKAIFPRKP